MTQTNGTPSSEIVTEQKETDESTDESEYNAFDKLLFSENAMSTPTRPSKKRLGKYYTNRSFFDTVFVVVMDLMIYILIKKIFNFS